MEKVIIYTSNFCPFCIMAKDLLESKGASYQELRVDENQKFMEEAVLKSGGMKTVPQIFINDIHVGGFDDLNALDKDGKLDDLLGI